jgi:two-component system OmpR family response regulator
MLAAYHRRVRVLVVDDDTRMSALLRRGLVEEGYAVDVAGEGGEAVWLAPRTTMTRWCWT